MKRVNAANNNQTSGNTSSSSVGGIDLPEWIFEVDEDDDIDIQTSILQELDIDPKQIFNMSYVLTNDDSVVWMLSGPWLYIFRRKADRHPLNVNSNNSSNQSNSSIDFWGPCSIISVYSAILWLGRVRDVPWTYVIWTVASIFNHFILRGFTRSTLLLNMSILGYSLVPILPLSVIIILFHPPIWISNAIQLLCVFWSSISAILSYISIFSSNVSIESKSKISLLFPAIILMELYFISLLPIRHRRQIDRQINSDVANQIVNLIDRNLNNTLVTSITR